jgi:glutaredoxin
VRAILIVAVVLGLAYYQYQKHFAEPAGSLAGAPPVLEMSADASAALARIAPGKVVLFSTAWCPYCAKVRKLLKSQDVRFTELDIEREGRYADFQNRYMQIRGFPVLVVGNRVIGGYQEPAILAALKEL